MCALFYPMNGYWLILISLYWPDDWIIIFKQTSCKNASAVSEHPAVQIMQMVSGGRNCTSRPINKSSDLSVFNSTRLYEFRHQGTQHFFFKKDGFYFEKVVCIFHNKNSEVNTTKQKCSHAHNSARTLQVLVTLFCPCLFQTFLTSLYIFFCFSSPHFSKLPPTPLSSKGECSQAEYVCICEEFHVRCRPAGGLCIDLVVIISCLTHQHQNLCIPQSQRFSIISQYVNINAAHNQPILSLATNVLNMIDSICKGFWLCAHVQKPTVTVCVRGTSGLHITSDTLSELEHKLRSPGSAVASITTRPADVTALAGFVRRPI